MLFKTIYGSIDDYNDQSLVAGSAWLWSNLFDRAYLAHQNVFHEVGHIYSQICNKSAHIDLI